MNSPICWQTQEPMAARRHLPVQASGCGDGWRAKGDKVVNKNQVGLRGGWGGWVAGTGGACAE
jgi:hypothetical protein